jgi:hypothetical protein
MNGRVMAETKKSKADNGTVFDVAKPDQPAKPVATKPTIVTNRSTLLKSPTGSAGDTDPPAGGDQAVAGENLPTTKKSVSSLSKVKIEPVTKDLKIATEPETAKPEDTEDPDTDTAENDADESTVDTEKQPSKTAADTVELEEQAEHDAEVQNLVESHKYYLSINQVEKRRSKRTVVLGIVLAVVLALAWADVAIDSGILSIPGVKAPTHFFK